MKKFKVVDARGEKVFESISAVKKWYSIAFDSNPNTNHYEDTLFLSREIGPAGLKLRLFLSYVFVNDKVYKISAKFHAAENEYIGTASRAVAYVNKNYGGKYSLTVADFEKEISNTIYELQAAKNHELFTKKITSFKKDFKALIEKYKFNVNYEVENEFADYINLSIFDKEYREGVNFIKILEEV